MKYAIEQFPKNKSINLCNLSPDQKEIRRNKNIERYKDGIRCTCCQNVQDCTEFYFKNKEIGLRLTICRDCLMRKKGTVEIGRNRFSQKIFKKGFQRCYICREIKPISLFIKKNNKRGCAEECDKCRIELLRSKRQKKYAQNGGRKGNGEKGGRSSLGEIKVINLITNEILIFKSTNDPNLLKMFDRSTVDRCIKSGEPTKAGNRSKYKNPCIIERLIE